MSAFAEKPTVPCEACKQQTLTEDMVRLDDAYFCQRCGACAWCYMPMPLGEGRKSLRGWRFCGECVSEQKEKLFTHPIPGVSEERLLMVAVAALEREVRRRREPLSIAAEEQKEEAAYDGSELEADARYPGLRGAVATIRDARGEPLDSDPSEGWRHPRAEVDHGE